MNNKYSVYYDGDGYYFKIGDELTKSIGDVVNAMIEDIKGEGKFVDVEFVDEIYKLIFTLYGTHYFFFCDPSLDKFVGNTSKNLVFEQLVTTFLEELYNTLTEIKKNKGKVIVKEMKMDKELIKTFIFITTVVVVTIGVSLSIIAGLYAIICWAFGFNFSFQIAFGVWALLALLSVIFKR